MITIGLACLLTLACAKAELSLEQVKLQYEVEEAEHLQQKLEVTTKSTMPSMSKSNLPF